MRTPESMLRDERPTDGLESAIAAFSPPYALGAERTADPAIGPNVLPGQLVLPREHGSSSDGVGPQHGSRGIKAGRWPAAAGFAASVGLAVVALRLSATAAEASPLARIAAAERNAPRCVSRLYDGTGRLWGVLWQEGRRTRFDNDPDAPYGSSGANDGRRTWHIDKGSQSAFIVTDPVALIAPLQTKVADYVGNATVLSTTIEGDRKTLVVERPASRTSSRQRDTLVVDRQDRPIEVRYETIKDGRWSLSGREVRDYDTPIPSVTFEFHPPRGYETYDINANRARLIDGLRHGPSKTLGGLTVWLAGVLQDRHGTLTAVYTGGTTPLPDAAALATRDGKAYSGAALVGEAPESRARRPIGQGAFRAPGAVLRPSADEVVKAMPEPYAKLGGVGVRVVQFELPKAMHNSAQRVRVTLPIVEEGALRTIRSVQGRGVPKGTATFDVVTIPSNGGEEIFRLPSVKRSSYSIRLARPRS